MTLFDIIACKLYYNVCVCVCVCLILTMPCCTYMRDKTPPGPELWP